MFNANSDLPQNRAKKQIIPFKTLVHWLFSDIKCYLVIVRVYYILNNKL